MQRRRIDAGYGKVILFGEHLVIHGYKALVAALPLKTYATVARAKNDTLIIDKRPKVPTFKPIKFVAYETMVRETAKNLGVHDKLEILLDGDLPVTSGGIGSSAAASVAVAKALSRFCGTQYSLDELNQVAYGGECCIHGTPSGIDNTAALYGGIFLFDRANGRNVLKAPYPLYIVIVDSGITADTATAIKRFKNEVISYNRSINPWVSQYTLLIPKAIEAVQTGDWSLLGSLMLENHEILRNLNVSCDLLDEMVAIAVKMGALGAKMSGSGNGGIMIALVQSIEEQQRLKIAFNERGFWSLAVALDYSTIDLYQEL